ncbi:LuxR C-terminal-related transcriptional regulator [Anoxynatronum sibiricum]|uniref:LuxR C-terminal-related transcriptional regulator n=1 Tax=Anoxynatronum sibiricum TaxID=210623 RepID=A0ABU9VT62_9CLOT
MLNTKARTTLPPPRPKLVNRRRLVSLLNEGLLAGRRATLISAPAGYGKSVLASEWVRSIQTNSEGLQVFWLSLESSDDNPGRFLAYLSAAFLNQPLTIASINRDSDFNSPIPEHVEQLLHSMLFSLSEWENQSGNGLFIVLDDYHRIHSPFIHQIVQYLIDHSPPCLHILLVTREDPPLSIPRLRAHGEITEIRLRDLAFDIPEATEFITSIMGTTIRPEWVADLFERTEGWAVGLQLAALSLRQCSDIGAFINHFKGSHRYLVDYLIEEVIKSQPSEIRHFLKQTSVLKSFNHELCTEMAEQKRSQDILRQLEKSNLFLIALDEQKEWYRYHHLFADCLRKQLSKEEKNRLYRIAANWSEKRGYLADAVEYALASEDHNVAADTIERVLKNPLIWSRGYVSLLESWLIKLPPDFIGCRPDLQIMASRVLFLSGKLEESAFLLDRGEVMLQEFPLQDEIFQKSLSAQIHIYRAALLAMNGKVVDGLRLIDPAMSELSPDLIHIKARGYDTLGLIYELAGNFEESYHFYLKASDFAGRAGVLYLAINALCEAASVRLAQGKMGEAKQTCFQALELAGDEKHIIPPAGLAWAVLGEIAREENDLKEAKHCLDKAAELAGKGGIVDDLRHVYFYQTQLQMSRQDFGMMTEHLGILVGILESYRVQRLSIRAGAIKARVALLKGHLQKAVSWASQFQSFLNSSSVQYLIDYELLTMIRVKMAVNQYLESSQLAGELIDQCRAGNRNKTLLEALMLHTIACWYRGDKEGLMNSFHDALLIAEAEGYVRSFTDEGLILKQIFEYALPLLKEPSLKAYGKSLFNTFSAEPPAIDVSGLLSEQEARILQLIASGLSNQEIAKKLFISLGTVKWHAHNIYEKLGVSSRTQAVVRGRELKVITGIGGHKP